MKYREKLYPAYVSASAHTRKQYGDVLLKEIEGQFPVWRKYYGRFLPLDKNARILDIGCGNGGFIHFLQSLGYKNAMGIDISKEQVESAKKLGIQNVMHADLTEYLSRKPCYYSAIFARDVIEHFVKDEILEILSLIYSSLENKGTVVVQTPNAEGPFGGRYRYWDFTHEIAFTRTSLNQILGITGFQEITFYPTGPVPKGLKSAVRYVLWNAMQSALRFYMLVESGTGEGIFTLNIISNARKQS